MVFSRYDLKFQFFGYRKKVQIPFFVIPAKAGIHFFQYLLDAGSSPA